MIVNVGFNHFVPVDKIVAIIPVGSASSRRLKEWARSEGKLIDATSGKKAKCMVITPHYIILSALNPETIAMRLKKEGEYGSSG